MLLTATVTYVLLCLVPLLSGQSICHKDAPDTCDFSAGACNWSSEGWHEESYLGNRCMKCIRDKAQGVISSRTACSTEGEAHCFKFKYHFTQDTVLTLSVLINETDGDMSRLLWRKSSRPDFSGNWGKGNVPIAATGSFTVVIKSQRLGNDTVNSVYVGDLLYEKSSCKLSPATANPPVPTTTTSTTRPPTEYTPTISTKKLQSEQTSTQQTSMPPSIPTSAIVFTNTISTSANEASSRVGTIVGVAVAAVVVVAATIMIGVFLIWRKQDNVRNCCGRSQTNKNNSQVSASQNALANDGRDTDNSTELVRESVYENHFLNTPLQTLSPLYVNHVETAFAVTDNPSSSAKVGPGTDRNVLYANSDIQTSGDDDDRTYQNAQGYQPPGPQQDTGEYGRLDFTNADNERSVYTDLYQEQTTAKDSYNSQEI